MPGLVLGVTDVPLTANLGHPTLGQTETKVEGYVVTLQKKDAGGGQTWNFTTEGHIYCTVSKQIVDMTMILTQIITGFSQLIEIYMTLYTQYILAHTVEPVLVTDSVVLKCSSW